MLNPDFTHNLKPQEEVIKLIKPSLIIYTGKFLLGSLFIIIAFFLFYPLFQLNMVGIIIFIILLLTGIILNLKTYLCYKNTALLVTDLRVVDFDQKGLFSKEVSEIIFENIEDISYNKKGLLATLFNYGTIEIQTAAQKINIVIKGVKDPAKIQSLITDIKTG